MIPLINSLGGAFTALSSSRKFSRRTSTARRRLAALRAVTARQRFGMVSRAAALFGAGAVILLGSQSKSSAQTMTADAQYQYQNSTGFFSTGFTPTLTTGDAMTELNFGGTGPYTATDDIAAITVNDLSFFNTGLVTIASGAAGNTITLAGTTPQVFVGTNGSALIDVILAGATSTTGLAKTGFGTLTLGAANTYTGATAVNQGALALDFTQTGAPATNILAATSTLTLAGGTFSLTGAAGGTNAQTVASTALSAGGSNLVLTPGSGGTLTLSTGTITRAAGGTLNVTVPTGSTLNVGSSALGNYITLNGTDYVTKDASNNLIALTYTNATGTQSGATGNLNATGNLTFSGTQSFFTSVRFNTPAATSSSGAITAINAGNVLVGTGEGANNVTMSGIRQSGSGAEFDLSQQNTLGYLTMTALSGASANNNILTKYGAGTLFLNGSNGFISTINLNGGSLVVASDLGFGATTGTLNLGGGSLVANASFSTAKPIVARNGGGTLSATTGNTFTTTGNITGVGPLTIGFGTLVGSGAGTANTTAVLGGGIVALTGTGSTYSGGTTLNAGTLQLQSTNLNVFGTGGLTFNGGTFQYASGISADLSARSVTLGGITTIDTNGNTVTFANAIGTGGAGGLTKVGLGTLTLNGANAYAGGTIVNGGSLLINNTTGSGTGTGSVTVNSGGTFGGTGTSTGAATVNGGGILASNTISPATLTLGSLNLADQSITNFGFGMGNNATITITGALSLNGTDKVNLYQIGTVSTFATAGTYTLFTDGSLTGSVSSLVVNNQAANTTYAFTQVGNTIRLTISGGLVNSVWNVDNNGNYSVPGNWTNGVPNTTGAQAVFGSVITAPRTVMVDGTFTVGEIDFNNANAYTLTPAVASNGFVFNNGSGSAVINDINGSHTIQTPIALSLGLNVTVANAADALTVSSAISNTGAAGTGTLAKTGAGTLALLGANTFDGGVTVTNGKVQINSAASLGAVAGMATLDSTANTVTLEALNSVVTARNFAINGINTNVQVDPGATYEIDGVIAVGTSGAGTLTKTGTGTLALGNANTYAGITTISAGTLSLVSAGSNGGSVVGNIVDNSALTLARTDISTVSNIISGTGTVSQTGSGNTTLSGANTYTGLTTVTGGTLTLGNALALQNSTLNYDNLGGTLSFGTQTAITLGGLTGAQSLALTNAAATPAGVALTINNANTNTYTGTLGGLGSLIKNGAGALTIGSGVNGGATYTGTTTVNVGTMTIGGASNLVGQVFVGSANGTSALVVQDNAVVNSTGQLILAGVGSTATASPTSLTLRGNANFTAPSFEYGNGSRVTTASVTVGTATTDNAFLIINGAFDLLNETAGTTASSTPTTNVSAGGTLEVQRFIVSGTGGTNASLTALRLNGGTLVALANDPTGASFLPTNGKLAVDVDSGGAVVNTNGFSVTFAQPLVHGTGTPDGGLAKNGLGTLTLAGANTYNGATTINNGALNFVAGGSTLAASAVTVNSGGTLSGTGGTVAGTIAVNGGGTLLAGTGGATPTVGNLTTGAVTLNAGSTFGAVLGGDTSVSQLLSASVSAAGNFGITLTGAATFAATGEALTLIPASSNFTGTFTNTSFSTGGYTFTADYLTNLGAFDVDVSIAAVPEPATWLAGFLMVGALGYKKRKQIGSLLNT